jgi:hypothetical protein
MKCSRCVSRRNYSHTIHLFFFHAICFGRFVCNYLFYFFSLICFSLFYKYSFSYKKCNNKKLTVFKVLLFLLILFPLAIISPSYCLLFFLTRNSIEQIIRMVNQMWISFFYLETFFPPHFLLPTTHMLLVQ